MVYNSISCQTYKKYGNSEIETDFSTYIFLTRISLHIILASTKFSTFIENVIMQGTESQNFDLGLRFDFMTKTGKYLRHRSLSMGINNMY